MNIVLLGGNGYLGRNVSEKILSSKFDAQLFVVSRSGKNELFDSRLTNIAVDTNDYDAVKASLPDKVDYIIDFIGRPEKNPELLQQLNMAPATLMRKLAEEYNAKAMGIIGGILGDKSFVNIKAEAIAMLQESSVPLAYVEPTLVYGNGRKDSMTKLVPLLKFFGIFSKKFKPVDVNDVAEELVTKLFKY